MRCAAISNRMECITIWATGRKLSCVSNNSADGKLSRETRASLISKVFPQTCDSVHRLLARARGKDYMNSTSTVWENDWFCRKKNILKTLSCDPYKDFWFYMETCYEHQKSSKKCSVNCKLNKIMSHSFSTIPYTFIRYGGMSTHLSFPVETVESESVHWICITAVYATRKGWLLQ